MTDFYDALDGLCRPVLAADFPRPLAPMRRLLAALGDPQEHFAAVVVAGSVGKGTAAVGIANTLASPAGPIGLYTGPHLHSFRERFVIDGQRISQEAFAATAERVLAAARRLESAYSTFELATALGLLWFAQQRVGLAVLEVGVGGRWDAVNAADAALAVITPLEREHIRMLGGSLQTIAWHKAGILRPGRRAIAAPQPPAAADVLAVEAARLGAELTFVPDAEALPAAAGCELAARGLAAATSAPAAGGLFAPLPGRLEIIERGGQTLVIDGAHTPSGAARLRAQLDALAGAEAPIYLIAAMLADKDPAAFLRVFDRPGCRLALPALPGHRALPPEALRLKAGLRLARIEQFPTPEAALAAARRAPERLVVITGSLRLAAAAREALGLLTPAELAEAAATRARFEGPDYRRRAGG